METVLVEHFFWFAVFGGVQCEQRGERRLWHSDFLRHFLNFCSGGSKPFTAMSFASPSALSGKKRAAPMTNAEMQQFDALIEDMDIESAS